MSLISSPTWKFAKCIGIKAGEAHVSKLKWPPKKGINPSCTVVCPANVSEGPAGPYGWLSCSLALAIREPQCRGERSKGCLWAEARTLVFAFQGRVLSGTSFISQSTSWRCATRELQHPGHHSSFPFCYVIPRQCHMPHWVIWRIQNTKCKEPGI